MNLQTRKNVIDIWLKQSDDLLNSYVCPNCRDILEKSRTKKDTYYCVNEDCACCDFEIW